MSTHASRSAAPAAPRVGRVAWALAGAALLAASIVAAAEHGAWAAFAAGAVGPDAALVLGAGAGLARGQLHPRAVPLYNALHRLAGPVVLVALGVAGVAPAAVLVGGLAWATHVAIDRACGYGLRTRDGFQRGR